MSAPVQLPPASAPNAWAPGDEQPIILTQQGYEISQIPGVVYPPPPPLKYVTYVGPSF
jgi:hypothetical protein